MAAGTREPGRATCETTDAKLAFPWGLAYVGTDLYISDNGLRPFVGGESPFGNRLRKVDASGVEESRSWATACPPPRPR